MANPNGNDDFYAVDEDGTLIAGSNPYGVLNNDSDPDGDAITAAKLTDPANGTLVFNSDGTFTYTPDEDFFGLDTFTYRVSDSYGDFDDATVEINVQSKVVIVREDEAFTFGQRFQVPDIDGAWTVELSDPYLGNLTFGVTTGLTREGDSISITGTADQVNEVLASMVFTYDDTADTSFGNGLDYLNLQIFGPDGYYDAPDVEIRIAAPDDIVEEDLVALQGDNHSRLDALDLTEAFRLFEDPDLEAGSGEGGGGVITALDASTTPHVSVLGTGNDELDWYSFEVDEVGTVILDIDYADKSGGEGSTSFDSVIAFYDSEGNLIAFDDDGDGDPGSSSSFDSHLEIDFAELGLTPGTYYVSVGEFESESGGGEGDPPQGAIGEGKTYQLNITSPTYPNEDPLAVNDARTVSERVDSISLAAVFTGNLRQNDTDGDGDELTVTLLDGLSVPTGATGRTVTGDFGTLTLLASGAYTYAVKNTDDLIEGETGQDVFTYEISDGQGGTDTATVTFTVTGRDLDLTTSGIFTAHRGDDEIAGGGAADQLAGREGDDILRGNGGNDTLWGEAGADQIHAGSGNDKGIGGAGDDRMWLGDGIDTGHGEDGDDTIYGENGDDSLVGGDDNDTLYGGANNDKLFGNNGNDQLWFGSGNDGGWGEAGNDKLWGEAGNDTLVGGSGTDTLDGGANDDKLWGDDGNDTLTGGSGVDQLTGGAGSDKLYLDGGNDTAWGGVNSDQFIFKPGFGQDRIKDFQDGDRIVFDGVFTSFSQVRNAMVDTGSNIEIRVPGSSDKIIVEKVASLDSGDFLFI